MVATMLNDLANKESILVLVLEPTNLERMRKADPVTVETKQNRGILDAPKFPEKMRVLIAYEEDDVTLWQLARGGSVGDLLRYLARGWDFKPEVDGTTHAFKLNS